jgi:hypothetical protein
MLSTRSDFAATDSIDEGVAHRNGKLSANEQVKLLHLKSKLERKKQLLFSGVERRVFLLRRDIFVCSTYWHHLRANSVRGAARWRSVRQHISRNSSNGIHSSL